jgi:hypothetical protein
MKSFNYANFSDKIFPNFSRYCLAERANRLNYNAENMKKCFLLLNIIFLGVIVFSNANAQSSSDTRESARIFVQKFYDWYFPLFAAPPEKKDTIPSSTVAINQRGDYFDIPLRKALIDDANAQSKAKELVGLDFDPFLNAQDVALGYQTGSVKQVGSNFFVDIHNIENGKSKKAILASELIVIAEVVKLDGHWKFRDFIYPDKNNRLRLLDILKANRKDREKATE